jgi:hypothetical protein
MKSNELRIGSIYKSPIEFFKGSIEAKLHAKDECFILTKEKMVLLFQTGMLELVHPVELTEEWVFKLGGRISDDSEIERSFTVNDKSLDIVLYGGNYSLAGENHGCMINFDYVHQLQNFFYAWANEDLIIQK